MLKKILAVIAAAAITAELSLCCSAAENKICREYHVLSEATTASVLEGAGESEKVSVGVLAKLMTILLAAESIEDGRMSLDDVVTISSNANSKQGAQIWIMQGEKITVSELMKGIIIGNANDASAAIAEKISGTEEKFVEKMNQRACELGMDDTIFTNPDGYYDSDKQISTAEDISVLLSKLSEYDCFDEMFSCKLDNIREDKTMLVNSNKLTGKYSGLKGYKTGYTEASGYCGAFLAERGGRVYSAVLLGYDDEDKMLLSAVKILDRGFAFYRLFTPEMPSDIPMNIKVKNSRKDKIRIGYDNADSIIVKTGEAEDIRAVTHLPEYLYAPVKRGEKVGEVHFYKKDSYAFSVEITAEENAEKINMQNIIVNLLKKIVGF